MSKEYKLTVGLEVHAELKTDSKMFCGCANDPDENEPNVNVCPVCMGHPGSLPVINKEAVRNVLRMGVAVGGTLADYTEFDRKNYFYPDIPKGYQISQYKYPLVSGGELAGVALTRIHLEEDTAKSSHIEGDAEHSLIDFNRAGVPLMELVTEPVIHDAKTAGDFARELQLLLRTLRVGEANMEKGEMRVEANISVSAEEGKLGTKVEVKNLNSFKSVERSIEYEVARHIELLERGEEVVQETRGWDEEKQITFSQRQKESAHDYRYFPDPDLPKLKLSEILEFSHDTLAGSLPELPWERRERYSSLGLKDDDMEFFTREMVWGDFLDTVSENLDKEHILLAVNYISSDLVGLSGGRGVGRVTPEQFAKLVNMVASDTLNSRAAKDILTLMYEEGGDPQVIAQEKNMLQMSDEGEIENVVREVITEQPKVTDDYRAGKESALQFLVGQVMKKTKGRANPATALALLKKNLS